MVAAADDTLRLTEAAALIHRSPNWLRLRIDRGMVEAEQIGRIWYVSRASLMQMPRHDLRGSHPRSARPAPADMSDAIRARIERAEAARLRRMEAIRRRFPNMAYVNRGDVREYVLNELIPTRECGHDRPARVCWCGREAD